MDKGKTNLPFRKHFGGILQKLFYAVLDEEQRYEAVPREFSRSKEEIQKHPFPAPVETFYVKSVEMLNEIGKMYPAQSAEEVFLCKKLAEYDKIKVEEDFIEGANRIESTIHPPIRQFINEHYADIIAINKQYRKEDGEDTNCDILENLNLSKEKKTALESLQRIFEDGANKYPRLIHLVLKWPLFSRMPKPPRDMLSFCDQQEYNRMLERRKKDVFNSVGGFSGIETQSTHWFLYPKGESWNKDSGIKRFQDLLIDAYNLLGCDWLKLLHKHVSLMSPWSVSVDGWDGLFDEDYDFQEEGYRKGLYKSYYITDVFYESIRLCRKLLDSETEKQEDTTKKYCEILHLAAEQASVEEIRIMYEVIEFLWIWISRDVPKNKHDFVKAWADLYATTNDRMTKITTWLKWNKSELAKDIETEYSEFINFVEKEISDSPVCIDLIASFTAAKGTAINLAVKLRHVAELAKTLKIEDKTPSEQPAGTVRENGLSKELLKMTDTESNILEALGKNTLIGEKLAVSAGYPYNSNFKNTLSSLRKRGILGNKSPGYFLEPAYYYLLNEPDKSQDKGQD